MPIVFQRLLGFPVFQSLPQETLMRLARQMTERQFARREIVASKERTRFELGFLLDGRLQGVDFTVDGRGVGLYYVEPGEYFGELPIIDGKPPPEHIVAAVRSAAAFLDAGPAHRLIVETPALAQTVLARMAARVRAAALQRHLLALPNPFQRLCMQLSLLAGQSASRADRIEPAPTHQELAMMINASRETVTRAFQVLMLHGALRREGSVLHVLRGDYLAQIAQGRIEPPRA